MLICGSEIIKMLSKKRFFFLAIILLGFLDWLTTIIGIASNGAIEINPLLSGLTKSNLLIFTLAKLMGVIFAGLAFYKAEALSKPVINQALITRNFLNIMFLVTCVILVTVVTSNILTIAKV